MPHHSQGILVFWFQSHWGNCIRITSNGGAKQRWGRLKSTIFD